MKFKVSFSLPIDEKRKLTAIAADDGKPLSHVAEDIISKYLNGCEDPKPEKPISKVTIEQYDGGVVVASYNDRSDDTFTRRWNGVLKDGVPLVEQLNDLFSRIKTDYYAPRAGKWVVTDSGIIGKVHSITNFEVILEGYKWPFDYQAIMCINDAPKFAPRSEVTIDSGEIGMVEAVYLDDHYLVRVNGTAHVYSGDELKKKGEA